MKIKLIIATLLIVSLVLFFGFLAYHASGQYKIMDGKLYAGNREVSSINMQQYKQLSSEIVKDSSLVFYKGKVVAGVDAPTFERLPNTEFFYRDKNALYFERWGVFTIHKLIKLDEEFDVKTMKSFGSYSLVLRDKNGLYVLNNNPVAWFNLKNPLKCINLKGIDTTSFYQITSEKGWNNAHFYSDNNAIFFATYSHLRPCPEMDANSFQIVDYYLFKDKNKVFYLTQFLESDTKKKTANAGYAILEGADGETFHKISDANNQDFLTRRNWGLGGQLSLYEDKNGQWEIFHIVQRHHRYRGYFIDKKVIRKVKSR